ncbi:MAG: hypothetical protein ACRD96_01620, partial [Bryobacteraceae bacterium]
PTGAHSDPSDYDREFRISIWRGGKRIDGRTGRLGALVGESIRPAPKPADGLELAWTLFRN